MGYMLYISVMTTVCGLFFSYYVSVEVLNVGHAYHFVQLQPDVCGFYYPEKGVKRRRFRVKKHWEMVNNTSLNVQIYHV